MIKESENISLGIFCLPSEQEAPIFRTGGGQKKKILGKADDLKNSPHLSIFQMQTQTSRLSDIAQKVEEVSKNYPPFDLEKASVENRWGNICLAFHPDPKGTFRDMASTIVKLTRCYRGAEILPQIQWEKLTPLQQDLVEEYGIFWNVPPEKSTPYLTLFYNAQIQTSPPSPYLPLDLKTLHFDRIAMGKIGLSGNVEQIFEEFPLCP